MAFIRENPQNVGKYRLSHDFQGWIKMPVFYWTNESRDLNTSLPLAGLSAVLFNPDKLCLVFALSFPLMKFPLGNAQNN